MIAEASLDSFNGDRAEFRSDYLVDAIQTVERVEHILVVILLIGVGGTQKVIGVGPSGGFDVEDFPASIADHLIADGGERDVVEDFEHFTELRHPSAARCLMHSHLEPDESAAVPALLPSGRLEC